MSDISDELRENVTRRAGGRCEYCHAPSEGQIAWFPIDHIVPRNAGGLTEESNLALACPRCNASKWAFVDGVDPDTGSTVGLFNPRTQQWEEHFAWSEGDDPILNGTTIVGRATIFRLKINAADAVAIRKLLVDLGVFHLR